MKPLKRGLLLAVVSLLLAHCAGADVDPDHGASFPASPLLAADSDGHLLHIELRSSPQPLERGVNALQFTISDASSGQPVSGLLFSLQPWMPDMGHGSSVTPVVLEQGAGVYEVSNVSLSMPGTWQLRATFSGPVNDTVEPSVQIP
jgi:hypothetical protein